MECRKWICNIITGNFSGRSKYPHWGNGSFQSVSELKSGIKPAFFGFRSLSQVLPFMRNKQESVLGVNIGRCLSLRSAMVRRCAKRIEHILTLQYACYSLCSMLCTHYSFTYCLSFRWESIQHQQHSAASGNLGDKEKLCFLNTEIMCFLVFHTRSEQ